MTPTLGRPATTARRSLSTLLVITLCATLALFSDPRPAQAFAPSPIPVTLPPSVGGALAGAVGGGAASAGALAAGAGAAGWYAGTAAVCFFTSLPCLLPDWGQKEDVPPNSDQPLEYGLRWVPDASVTAAHASGGGQTTYTVSVTGITKGSFSSGYTFNWSPVHPPGSWPAVGAGSLYIECRTPQGVIAYGGGTAGGIFDGPGTRSGSGSCPAVGGVQSYTTGGLHVVGNITGDTATYTVEGAEATQADPDRTGQAWRECAASGSPGAESVIVFGDAITYRESQAPGSRPPISLPACPSSHPVPLSYGFGTPAQPVAPGAYPPGTHPLPNPARGLPPAPGYPTTYPECPTPGSCPVGRPSPGTGVAPLPLPNPDGSPGTLPTPAPGDSYCMWGPYAVPESDCQETGGTQPEPKPDDTTTGLDPVPQTDPDGCLSRAVTLNPWTWVYAPVKCALQWFDANLLRPTLAWLSDTVLKPLLTWFSGTVLEPMLGWFTETLLKPTLEWGFGLSPATQLRVETVGADLGTLFPFNVATDVPNWLAPIATPGTSCPDWTVVIGSSTHSVVCDQPFMQRINAHRVAFGSAMVMVMIAPFAWRVWHASFPVIRVQSSGRS